MSMNINWPRWIFASVSKHFSTNSGGITMYIEGDDRDTGKETNYFEFRMNGPMLHELTQDFWRIDICINILISSKRNDASIHTLQTLVGTLASAFKNSIEVYKYGNDNSLLGCLILRKIGDDVIKISNLGILNPEVQINQSSIEAYYRMYLET